MSVGNSGLPRITSRKGIPVEGSKLSGGLPALRYEGNRSMLTQSMKSLSVHATPERVQLYRNDDERQNVMKRINE